MTTQTYAHRFSNGLTAQTTIDSAKVARGDMDALNFIWSRTPTRAENEGMREEYIEWKNSIMQRVADDTGMRILDIVQIGPNEWAPREFIPQPPAAAGQR